jgi:hypothetical protein
MTQTARPLAVLAFGLALAASPASAQDPDNRPPAERYFLRLQYRHFIPDLTGDATKGTDDSGLVDFNDDLGFKDDSTFDARAMIQFGRGKKLRGSYTMLDYHGDQDAPKTFTYGGTRYERFNRIVSSVKGGYYSLDYQWDFVQRPKGFLGLIVGAKAFDVDTVVLDAADNQREVDTFRVPIPVVGLVGRGYSGRFSLEGELSGLSIGDRGHLFDGDATARFHISDRLAVQAGYRILKLTGRDDNDELNLRLGGWQFGVELSL